MTGENKEKEIEIVPIVKNTQKEQSRFQKVMLVFLLTILGLGVYGGIKIHLLPSELALTAKSLAYIGQGTFKTPFFQIHTEEVLVASLSNDEKLEAVEQKRLEVQAALENESEDKHVDLSQAPGKLSSEKDLEKDDFQADSLVDQKAAVSILGIPVKKVDLEVISDEMIVPCGMTVGVHIRTDGVMVLGTGVVTGIHGEMKSPVDGILEPGDIILSVNDTTIEDKEKLIDIVADSTGDLSLVVERNQEIIKATVQPVVDHLDGKRKLGCWIRESTKGIGTLTYYNPETNKFGALGHGILDVDTQKLMKVRSGEILESSVVTVKPGSKGSPGELIGNINNKHVLGSIKSNTDHGLYGYMDEGVTLPQEKVEIASQGEVHEGPAKMLSNVDGKETKSYDVYLENVYQYSKDESKGMVVRITDPALLTKTNGIVQGMSGSPLLQDGKIVGAVTHVFVQNPMKGYGIFIENMLKQEKDI